MKPIPTENDANKIAEQVAAVDSLGRAELQERWRALFGTEPHPRLGRELLTRAVAHRLQQDALGGLPPATRRLLERTGDDETARKPIRIAPARTPSPGTVLIREWQGATHHVTVVDDGVIFCDQRYRSLSEVARIITGTRWSGPLFFGLKGRAEEQSDGTN
ncbi:MAG: DUF2924 domain-containing protein [Candidatus Binataceae bacterium]